MKNIFYYLLLASILSACNQKSESTPLKPSNVVETQDKNSLSYRPTLEELKQAAKLEINNPNQKSENVCSKHNICPAFSSAKTAMEKIRPIAEMGKDQFETTDVFTQKKCSTLIQALKSVQSDTIDFEILGALYVVLYDADKNVFNFQLLNEASYFDDKSVKGHSKIPMALTGTDIGEYTGSNSFGVSRTIKKTTLESLSLLLPGRNPKNDFLKISLAKSVDEAKKLKNDFQIIISTKIKNPCLVAYQRRSNPTINDPKETDSKNFGIVGDKDAQWRIVQRSTGEILKAGHF